jgi:LytS/YehU family sensor histidine kinase
LYDTNQNYVAVQKEVDYIGNYVGLERIRLSDNVDIQVHISGDYTDRYIAPLLLIVFVENSFKHFSAPRGQQAFVHIHMGLQNSHLRLQVINSVDPGYVPVKSRSKGGLGLNNVKQRLNLIYPRQYTLHTTRETHFFKVDLTVDLS